MTKLSESKGDLAIAMYFMDAFSQLPAGARSKVSKFLVKYRDNPTASGLHYEKISASTGDTCMRSLRIDDNYRCIVFTPPKSNLRVLLHVNSHDEAYTWARRHACRIDDSAGGIFSVVGLDSAVETKREETVRTHAKKKEAPKLAPWARSLTPSQMKQLGVPEELFNKVKAITSSKDLELLGKKLAPTVYEKLLCLQDGEELDEVIHVFSSLEKEEEEYKTGHRENPLEDS